MHTISTFIIDHCNIADTLSQTKMHNRFTVAVAEAVCSNHHNSNTLEDVVVAVVMATSTWISIRLFLCLHNKQLVVVEVVVVVDNNPVSRVWKRNKVH